MSNENLPLSLSRPSRREKRPWRTLLIVLAVVSGLLLVGLIIRYIRLSENLAESAFQEAMGETEAAAGQLSQDFSTTIRLTEDLAGEISSGALPYDRLADRLQELLDQTPELDGVTVAFAHNAYSSQYDLFFIYVARDPEGGFRVEQKESEYDYTLPPSGDLDAPQTAWFYEPLTSGPVWTDPYFATGAERVLIGYGAPFYDPNGDDETPIGVVSTDYSLEGLRELVTDLDLGPTGYGAVYAQSGAFLSHPIPETVVAGNIFDDAQLQDENFQDAAVRALEGEQRSVQRLANEEKVWNFFAPIPATGWVLVSQISERSFLLGADALLLNQVGIVLAGGTFLFFLAGVLLHFDEATRDRLWLASILFSLIGVAMIVIIVVLERNAPKDLSDGILLTSQVQIDRYQEALGAEYLDRGLAMPVEVPTGMLIQSARFPEPSVVTLTGHLWQRIPKLDGAELKPGVSFPQIIDEPFMVEEVYREDRENETLIMWIFTAALRQAFNPEQYPLDRYDIKIRLAPKDFSRNVLLVPDLNAYNVTAPSRLPGLDDTVRINNWRLKASGFGLGFRQYGTTLGIAQRPTVDVPELAFNIRVERLFLGPFIAFFLPAFVATIMIFGFLLIDQKPDEPEEIVTALTYTAALFFVVAVLHDALRDNAAAIGLTYLEYFYLLLYVLTLFVAFNSFLVVKYPYLPVVNIGENLISKLLFWPIVVGFMLMATISVFVLGQ